MLWRIPLIAAILVAMFWGIWSLFGSVSATDHLQMTAKWTLQLPFSVSRWWDVLFAPIWALIFVLILSLKRTKKDKNLDSMLVVGLVLSLAVGMLFGLGVGLVIGLFAILVFGLASSFDLGIGLDVGLGVGLAVGLAVGLVFGLAVGLAVGLVLSLVIGLTVDLVILLKLIFSKKIWINIGQWVSGKS